MPFDAFAREQIKLVPEIARRMRQPEHLVRDWMDEGLARLWEQVPPIDPAGRERWLTTTVYRLHVDDLRKRRRAELHRSELIADVEAGQTERTPERIAMERECERLFDALVSRLSPREREVFLLHHDEELSLKEIAGRLDLDVEAVKYLLWKARRELKEAWARERAKDRFDATWAALAAAGVVLLLLVRRFFAPRPSSRGGVLLASAALALVAVSHGGPLREPPPPRVSELRDAESRGDFPVLAERSAVETLHLGEPLSADPPPRPAPAVPVRASSQVASASGRGGAPKLDRPAAESVEMPTRLLARARASLESGDRASARTMLAEYKSLYPHNPLRGQYDKIAADAFAP